MKASQGALTVIAKVRPAAGDNLRELLLTAFRWRALWQISARANDVATAPGKEWTTDLGPARGMRWR